MNLDALLNRIEHNLTPQMAILRWMTEVHEFGSVMNYSAWLVEQPPDAYPLRHLAGQVNEAAWKRLKGQPISLIDREICRVKREVIFLCFLHEEINHAVLGAETSLCLRTVVLIEMHRTLVHETGDETKRLFDEYLHQLEEEEGDPPNFCAASARRLRERKTQWTEVERALRTDVLSYLQAAELISARYFRGQDVLFPATRQVLTEVLGTLDGLWALYQETVAHGVFRNKGELSAYVMELLLPKEQRRPKKRVAAKEVKPDTTEASAAIVHDLLQGARVRTLEILGKRQAACRLLEERLRAAVHQAQELDIDC